MILTNKIVQINHFNLINWQLKLENIFADLNAFNIYPTLSFFDLIVILTCLTLGNAAIPSKKALTNC